MTSADEGRVIDNGDSWTLPVGEGVVTQLRFDHAFTVHIAAWIVVRIESEFTACLDGESAQYDPEKLPSTALAPLLGLNRATVTALTVGKDGSLALQGADWSIEVGPDHSYEAFNVNAVRNNLYDGSFQFVSLPGGDIAVFGEIE